MRKFLITSGVLLLLALAAVIGVFWYVSSQLSSVTVVGTKAPPLQSAESEVAEQAVGGVAHDTTPTSEVVAEYTFTPEQARVAQTIGIEGDTVLITQAMIDCASSKLETDRIDALVAGAAPTMLEIPVLLGCANVD